jgi:protein SCO1/2
MTITRTRWLLGAAAVLAALAGFWVASQIDRGAPRLASGTWLPQSRIVADFRLVDIFGQPFTRAELAGAPTLVFFGFTHCPDVCPTTLLKLARVKKAAGIARLRVLFVSIDPQRDTPQAVGLYVHAFDPAFAGVTGEPAQLAAVAQNFGVAVNRVDLPGGEYTMDHSAVVFLLDDAAHIDAIFTPPFEVAAMAADLKAAASYLTGARS